MEGLAHLVTESLARHNFEPTFDHRRIAWSKWFRCESNFSVLLAPSQPGVFALGEEIVAPGELSATGGKRMLALFHISEADDLGMGLGHLFLPGSPVRDRFASGRCFARYAVIEDANQRHAAYAALQQWAGSSSDAASGISNHMNLQSAPFSGGISQHLELQDTEPKAHRGPHSPPRRLLKEDAWDLDAGTSHLDRPGFEMLGQYNQPRRGVAIIAQRFSAGESRITTKSQRDGRNPYRNTNDKSPAGSPVTDKDRFSLARI